VAAAGADTSREVDSIISPAGDFRHGKAIGTLVPGVSAWRLQDDRGEAEESVQRWVCCERFGAAESGLAAKQFAKKEASLLVF
jgi:hypothetical protein